MLSLLLDDETGPIQHTNNAFTTKQRLNCALRFYATGSFQEAAADGEWGSQPNMSCFINRVSSVLANHSDDVIKFVVDKDICKKVSNGFYGSASK